MLSGPRARPGPHLSARMLLVTGPARRALVHERPAPSSRRGTPLRCDLQAPSGVSLTLPSGRQAAWRHTPRRPPPLVCLCATSRWRPAPSRRLRRKSWGCLRFCLGPCRTVAGRRGAPIGWAGATSLSLDLRSEGRRGGTLRDNAQVLTPAMTTYAVTPCPGTSRCAPGLCFRLRGRDHACAVPGPRTSWPGPPAPSCSHPPQIRTHGEHGDSLGHSRGHREARIGAGSHLHGSVS